MNELHPNQIIQTLEIYEYYDGPISRLVLFSSGRQALIESITVGAEYSEDLVIFLNSEDLTRLKKEQPLMKKFISEISTTNDIFVYRYNSKDVLIRKIPTCEVLNLLEEKISDEYYFEDNSHFWIDYC